MSYPDEKHRDRCRCCGRFAAVVLIDSFRLRRTRNDKGGAWNGKGGVNTPALTLRACCFGCRMGGGKVVDFFWVGRDNGW